jgi:hypothetical protein
MIWTFTDDDAAYRAWIESHPAGLVVNHDRQPSASYLKLHRAGCKSITRLKKGMTSWTEGDYGKTCSDVRSELESWAPSATSHPSAQLQPCGQCKPEDI